MTLQEKIDKLPLSIEYNGKEYFLHIECEVKKITLEYLDSVSCYNYLFFVFDDRILLNSSFRLNGLIDRALKIIKNKGWEK
jgi:hypothetical protein